MCCGQKIHTVKDKNQRRREELARKESEKVIADGWPTTVTKEVEKPQEVTVNG